MNEETINNIELNEGEVICSACKGRGIITGKGFDDMTSICEKCNGHGKVDWVTNAMGTPKRKFYGTSSNSGTSGAFGSSSYSYASYSHNTSFGTATTSGRAPRGNLTTSSYHHPPSNPSVGAVHIDSKTNNLKVFNGSEWKEVQ
jgi:hypothetical protein